MLTPSHSSTLPPPSQLEATCARLLELHEFRTVVALVEKWAETQDPTVEARLHQAEALLELKLMDKAWVRLKSLVDGGTGGIRPHLLSGRMFLERGWPAKARKVLAEGLERQPDHPELLALLERAQAPPEEVDTSKAEDDNASAQELVALAEHFMAQGAFVRARSMLERVRRGEDVPTRARQLLLALDGDFDLDEPISQVVARHGVLLSLPDIEEEGDHTESANLDDLPLQLERDDLDDRFPALFRGLSEDKVPETTADLDPSQEVTAVSSLSEVKAMLEASSQAAASAPGTGDDTQIMRVVHRGGVESVAPGAAHTNTPEPDASFNLADYQREMGMVPRPLSSDMDFVGPEDEDESVVVVTRQGEPDDPEFDAPERPRIQLDSSIDDQAARALGTNEDEAWQKPSSELETVTDIDREEFLAQNVAADDDVESGGEPTVDLDAPKPRAATPDLSDEPLTYEPPGGLVAWPWWVALIVLLMALGALMVAALVLAGMLL